MKDCVILLSGIELSSAGFSVDNPQISPNRLHRTVRLTRVTSLWMTEEVATLEGDDNISYMKNHTRFNQEKHRFPCSGLTLTPDDTFPRMLCFVLC